MEIVAVILSAVSLLTNIYMIKKFTGFIKVEQDEIVTLVEALPAAFCQCEKVSEPTPEPERKVETVETKSEAIGPWQNKKNIPWNESPAPPAQPIQPTVPGPLERPYGFT